MVFVSEKTQNPTLKHAKVLKVVSDKVSYHESEIISNYEYDTTKIVTCNDDEVVVKPEKMRLVFKTKKHVPKTGLMLVGIGGNNGTTLTGAFIANRRKLTWMTKKGKQQADFLGSITQASTVRIGAVQEKEIYVPFSHLLPMVKPEDVCISGWDISGKNLGDAMRRAEVFDYTLQEQLYEEMSQIVPLKGIYRADFIAANQDDRADNILDPKMPLKEQINHIRNDIREFKQKNGLDKVIILWTANTERFAEIKQGLNDTEENLLASVERNESEISPSTLYCMAAIFENCSYLNGSPQNTFVPGLVELANKHHVFIGGDDFKSGQTKIKSVLVDYLVSAGLKPTSIASYNHLGNNDGKNLSAPAQFRSKEISKSNVVDDMVQSNHILYRTEEEYPDHIVVIKYVPYVGDSKRALDEYTSEIFMGGLQTIVLHNTCEDSLLAAPLMIDLLVLTELFERISVKVENGNSEEFEKFNSVLSVLSYLLKAPNVPEKTPLVNALARQRACIENILKACIGLPADNHMLLEYKLNSLLKQ